MLSSPGQETSGELHIEQYVFENSEKEKVTAEFGKLTVSENPNDTHSRLIKIAFTHFKSTFPNPGSPIVYLAGDPGGQALRQHKATVSLYLWRCGILRCDCSRSARNLALDTEFSLTEQNSTEPVKHFGTRYSRSYI